MKKKMIIGTLSAVFVFGGAFAVGASNNDDGTKVEAKANNAKTFLSYDEVEKNCPSKSRWCSRRN